MNEWNTGKKTEVAEDCSYCGEKKGTIILSDHLLGVIARLCEEFPNDEWQMLLIGKEDGNVIRCTDYYVPKQEVTSASVRNMDCIDLAFIQERNIVATIHSHDNMGVFFSSTDHDSTNTSLIKNHIVCNNAGEFKATRAIILPCGMKKFIDAVVTRDMPEIKKVKRIKGFNNIDRKTYEYKPEYKGFKDEFTGFRNDLMDAEGHDARWIEGKRKKHALHFG